MEHGDIVGGMLTMEDAVWNCPPSYGEICHVEDDGEHGHHPSIDLQCTYLLFHHPYDVLGDEISHEWIARQEIYATLALRNAIEEEYKEEGKPCEYL